MKAEEFLKQDGLKPSSFDNQMRRWCYTESQLLAFAERYHKQEMEKVLEVDEDSINYKASNYEERSHSGHFSGEQPHYHYTNGAKWMLEHLKSKL